MGIFQNFRGGHINKQLSIVPSLRTNQSWRSQDPLLGFRTNPKKLVFVEVHVQCRSSHMGKMRRAGSSVASISNWLYSLFSSSPYIILSEVKSW